MRALITGVTGFVGQYLEKHLILQGAEVLGTSRNSNLLKNYHRLELSDTESIEKVIRLFKPSHIFHLAGISSVRDSWHNIKQTYDYNIMGTINLFEAVAKIDNGIRIITIGSCEEYGNVINMENGITEETAINPISPYGVSKAAVSKLIKQYQKGFCIDAVHLRPFNHIGPGQKLGFVTSDFAYQIALLNKDKSSNTLKVGNLETVRDFTDVRDIVKAYYQIALKGESGEIYNVCSGKGTKIQLILDQLVSLSNKNIKIIRDKDKFRPSDIPFYVGDPSKLNKITNWEPEIALYQSLEDIYDSWHNIIS